MAEVFSVDDLATYLHLTPQQVMRLADRGKIPGRKVGGAWVFAEAEVHLWLENRIGLSDEEELVEVEGVLEHAPGGHQVDEPVILSEILPIEAIEVPLAARTRNSVIDGMVDVAARTGWLWDPQKMADAVRSREEMHPTALENGVALMHPRRPMPNILGQSFIAMGVTRSGLPFGSGVPLTDVFFLVCSVDDRGHLRTLARLSRLLTLDGFLQTLREAPDAATVQALVRERELEL